MNINILDVVLLSTYFRDIHDEIHPDNTDPYNLRLTPVPERFSSITAGDLA